MENRLDLLALLNLDSSCISHLTAVSDSVGALTYGQLDSSSSSVASALHKCDLVSDDVIGIYLSRSCNIVTSLIGIIKAGAAFLLIDPEYPDDRVRYMIETCSLKAVLTEQKYISRISSLVENVLLIDGIKEAHNKTETKKCDLNGNSLLYLVFSSGSTGLPKGIRILHKTITALLLRQERDTELFKSPLTTLQLASLSFDVAIQEIFTSLYSRGCLHIVDEQTRRSPAKIVTEIFAGNVGRLFLTFPVLQQLSVAFIDFNLEAPCPVKLIVQAGEQLRMTDEIILFMRQSGAILVNQYGPAETHVVSSYALKDFDVSIEYCPPIGPPLEGIEFHVLGENRKIISEGIGELLICGDNCLADGYHGQSALTAEKFPIMEVEGLSKRVYKTGDLVSKALNGNFYYHGRVDRQVKIRGFRIELEEIERAIRESGDFDEVVVIGRTFSTSTRIVAYLVTTAAEAPFSAHKSTEKIRLLRNSLSKKLPPHSLPSSYVFVDKIPLSPNGKTDVDSLPLPSRRDLVVEDYVGPQTNLERIVCTMLEDMYGIEHIGINDSLKELGGDSILVMGMITKLYKRFGVMVPYEHFITGTVMDLSKCIELHSDRNIDIFSLDI